MTEKFLLIALYFGALLLYGLLNTRKNAPYDFRTRLDARIPFLPVFIYPYFGIFLFVPAATVFLFNTAFALPFLVSLIIGMYGAAIGWFLFPAQMHRPAVKGRALSEQLVALLYRDDPHANGFPSSHVINSTLTSFYLSLAFPGFTLVIWLIGIAIALSTVFIKQHRAVDVLGGIVWAAAAALCAGYFLR